MLISIKMTTESLILKVLSGKMKIGELQEKLENRGYILTYDTICKNLKQMYENGMLNREARGDNINQNTTRRHWNYYYSKRKIK